MSATDVTDLEPVMTLREDLAKIQEDQASVEQRKQELLQRVKDRIALLQQLLTQVETPAAAAPAAVPKIIDFVRQELESTGHPVKTKLLKQALIQKHGIPAVRLRNLSQILYKATSVYKANGKVGLATWKPTTRRKSTMSPENRQAVSDRMKKYWATKRAKGRKAKKAKA